MRVRICLLAAVLAQELALAVHGQQTPESAPTLKTQANLVLVDVVVTGNDGKVVGALPKDRFHLTDNGKSQALTVFEEHKPGVAPAVERPMQLGPNVYSNTPVYAIDSAANVILIDALNTPLADQTYVRDEMMAYLKRIPQGTRIAVFTLSSRLRMIEGFTTDASALSRALATKDALKQSGLYDPQFDQTVLSQGDTLAEMGLGAEALANMRQFEADYTTFQVDLRERITLSAFQSLARYLGTIPGRKNLVWFSGSFPIELGPDPSQESPFQTQRDYSADIKLTDAMLSQARVAVYPIDGRGLMLSPATLAQNNYANTSLVGSSGTGRGKAMGGLSAMAGPGAKAIKADSKFVHDTKVEHGTMQQIAEETGGAAFFDTNGLKEAVARAIENGSHYYTVGYVPDFKANDGSYHRIDVKVDGGLQAEYRRGYINLRSPTQPVNPASEQGQLAAALEQGAPPVSDLLFKVRVQPADAASQQNNAKSQRYALDYGIPANRLGYQLTPTGERDLHLELIAMAYNLDGKKIGSVDQNAVLKLTPDLYEKTQEYGILLHQELDLPLGDAVLRIVVRDLDGKRLGALEVPVVVKK
jgi:VWFA-related protein